MTQRRTAHPVPDVDSLIVTVRGQKVLLDSDLARIYGVPTFRFNEAVKRNEHRFPPDFRFRLTQAEWAEVRSLRSQDSIRQPGAGLNSSQIAMSSGRHRGAAYRPWAFTEHGAMMAANILNSEKMARLTATLEDQFSESARLEKAIRQNLKALNHA